MSFFKRKPKEPKTPEPLSPQSNAQDNQTNRLSPQITDQNDDLFGDMEVDFSTTTPSVDIETSPYQSKESNVRELQDLVLTTPVNDSEAQPSAFGFIHEQESELKEEPTSSFSFIDQDVDTTETDTADNLPEQNDDNKGLNIEQSTMATEKVTDTDSVQTEIESTNKDTKVPVKSVERSTTRKIKKRTTKAKHPGSAIKNKTEKRKENKEDDNKPKTDNQHWEGTGQGDEDTKQANTKQLAESAVKTESENPVSIEQATSENDSTKNQNIEPSEDNVDVTFRKEAISDGKKRPDEILIEHETIIEQNQPTSEDIAQNDLFDDDMNFKCTDSTNALESADENRVENEEDPTSMKIDDKVTTKEPETGISNIEVEANDHNGGGEPISIVESPTAADRVLKQVIGDQKNPTNNDVSFSLQLTEDEQFSLSVENLNMRKQDLWKETETLQKHKEDTLNHWQSSKVDIDTIPSQIEKLRLEQHVYAEKEDFDKAFEIQQQIKSLTDSLDNFKYQYPIFDPKITELFQLYKNTLTKSLGTRDELLDEYKQTMNLQEERIQKKTDETDFHDTELQNKEDKLKLDRELSHLSLDKEHYEQNHQILNDQMDKKTSQLKKDRQELVEKQNNVKQQIEELEAKLQALRTEETTYASKIDQIDQNIDIIKKEFQPRLQTIEQKRREINEEEGNINQQMDELKTRIEETNKSKTKVLETRERNKELLGDLKRNIEELESYHETRVNDTYGEFSIDVILDVNSFIREDDATIQRMKENLLQEEANTQSLKEKVHNDESSIGMLKRSLNNLEDQITEKKKAKQSAIAERRFMDAKHFTEEIKQMTEEGEQKQRELSSIEDGLKVSKQDLQNANKILEKLHKDYDYKLKEFDLKIIDNLRTINSDIDLFLIKNTETWFKEILELQVSSNEEIIKRLQNNHGLDENEVTSNTSKPDITEDLTKLESKLNEAVENEDFDLAQEISEQIKNLTNDTNS